MGLLDSLGAGIQGLLGNPDVRNSLLTSLAVTGPNSEERMALLMRQKAIQEEAKKAEELRQLQLEAYRRQMAQEDKLQQKDDITGAMIQSMNAQVADAVSRLRSSLSSNDMAGAQKARDELAALQSPEAQQIYRGHVATQGNPEMAMQAGLIPPPAKEYAPPEIVKVLAAAGIDPQSDQGKQIILQNLQQGSAQSMPANVQEWEFFSRLAPEDQARYIQMKRADRWINTGGSNVRIDPVTGAPAYEVPNTLPPEKQAERDASAASNALTVNELRSIIEPGGLLDQSTGSGLGAARDAVAGMVGASTTGAEAIAQLRPIAHRVLMNVPRFSGPQSDRDVQAYREAAGQVADPTLPVAIRKAAVKTIIDLMEKAQQYSPMSPVPGSSPAQNPADARLEELRQKYGM